MANEPIKSEKLNRAFDASTIYLKGIDDAIIELETNLAKLKSVRGHIKNNILGENPQGLSKALSEAGPAIGSGKELDEALMGELSNQLGITEKNET
jgi:hypothetical protein